MSRTAEPAVRSAKTRVWSDPVARRDRVLRASSSVFLRFALGFSFLSAVADRFGLWGAFGQPNVAWGNFARFVAYTGQLNWFLPRATYPTLAIAATCAETLLGILLVLGWQTRIAALLSGVLLLVFAVTMTAALGIKAPLSFGVFSAMGGAFLLASCADYPFSIDHLRGESLRGA
jgi:uncharacterized membrane protein YphA (DoxX/SURF4 family)